MLIYLIGYMYSGKSTVGRQLAQRLGCPFVDLDAAFEQRYHTTIPLFFQHYGEAAFRQLERQQLHATADLGDAVISTGGGTPCHSDNMQWILDHGTAVYLDVSLDTILQRAAASHKQRPVLAGLDATQRRDFITAQLAERLPYYRQAHILFPADDPDIDALAGKL